MVRGKGGLQLGLALFTVVSCLVLVVRTARAVPPVQWRSDEPSLTRAHACDPACRKGYTCRQGRCVSRCNPPCSPGERCVDDDCEARPTARTSKNNSILRGAYLALLGGYSAALSDVASGSGDLRAEFGGRNVALQLGPNFGDNSTAVRGAVVGNVPLRILHTAPLYIVPMLQLGYTFNWVDDEEETRQQDFFLTPGVRIRYDITRRLALLVDPIQVEVTFLRLQSNIKEDYHRIKEVPVRWGTHFGLAVLY